MILVTGGAGFIGSNLVDLLLEIGYSVRVLDDLSSGDEGNLAKARSCGNRFEFQHANINNFDSVMGAVVGVRCIIHLAAQVSVQYSISNPLQSANSNVAGFLNVLEAARLNKIERLIYASSAAVYGHPANLPLNEVTYLNPISPYGLEKMINEQYATLYSQIHGVSCLGFRFFNVYGPRQNPRSSYAGVISKFFERISNDQPVTIFGDGQQSRDFVYVTDVAAVCAKAIDSLASGVLCVGTGRSVNLLQLVQAIEAIIGKKASVIHAEVVDGDIHHSAMTPIKLSELLGVAADIKLHDGLRMLYQSLQEGI